MPVHKRIGCFDRRLDGRSTTSEVIASGNFSSVDLTRLKSALILNHMVYNSDKALDDIFAALSDPTRRSILNRLTQGEATVGELAEPHDMTVQAVSKHVRKLEAAGLVRRRREGREVHCRLEMEPMRRAVSWIEEQRRFWEVRLDRLDAVLKERQEKPPAS
jgi:DNA-binding transcriptional ArsR family regulator